MDELSIQLFRAIGDYRTILRKRKNISQSERMRRHEALNLRIKSKNATQADLVTVVKGIVSDITETLFRSRGGHAYSGLEQFRAHLEVLLARVDIGENGDIIDTERETSRAVVDAIQLCDLPEHRLDERIAKRLMSYNKLIARHGSVDQRKHYETALRLKSHAAQAFYGVILFHYEQLI